MRTAYFKSELEDDFLSAKYSSEDGRCELSYHASKALKNHPFSEMYNASITFRKQDIPKIINILVRLQDETKEER